ncbi:hypothetical protein POJ06DRAFT_251003 [Lipomyces tetrasporus]|uniref:Protein byr4 n=1 Tax=Lipomyces tetrasporus TaxID=54092 RepID=A0AAD7QTL1_9ASCO|nr:uncharacterized protein POJ06DRAFT_251003 [Lipomyces tetrasporus]KAJ8101263.1 hypothetical protein POJ06DRAFT_251003 [Lipomyces tetrasporus]
MSPPKRQLVPQRHPLSTLEKPIETWDDDSELDVEGDIFSKISARENRNSSSSLASSRNSRESFSFEDELMGLDGVDANSEARMSVNGRIPLPRNESSSKVAGIASRKLENKSTPAQFDNWGDDTDDGDESAILTIKAAKKPATDRPEDITNGSLFKSPIRSGGTLKQLPSRSPRLPFSNKVPTLFTLPETFKKSRQPDLLENMEMDFDLPESLTTIELKTAIRPGTPVQLDGDIEGWGEESVNSRYASSKRDALSNRSSLISTFSPASSVTYESEDEGLLGLQIPEGPLNFQRLLETRMKSFSPEPPTNPIGTAKEDFLDGLEIGDGDDIFDAGKLTFKLQSKPPNGLKPPIGPKPTRIPQPVSQTSATIPSHQLPQQATPKHQSSPPVGLDGAMSAGASRPERRLSHKVSMISVKTTTNQTSQRYGALLSKKSMPALRTATTESTFSNQPTTPTVPSIPSWLTCANPKQPNLRRVASRRGLAPPLPELHHDATPTLKEPQPFLAAGSGTQQSHHILSKHAKKSSTSVNDAPTRQTPSPKKDRHAPAPDSVRREAHTTKTLLKPVKRRLYGDGSELDAFEDLPISTVKERMFLTRPGKGVEGLGITTGKDKSYAVGETQTPSAMNLRPATREKPGRSRRKAQQRPHLIKPLGNIATAPRSEKGMRYNPTTYKWEGNDTATTDFDMIALTPPRPALISNITSNKGVQVVGGMIFDPVRMRWFKAVDNVSGPGGGDDGDDEDEDDPFAGFDDLVDDMAHLNIGTPKLRAGASSLQQHNAADTGNVYGEFVVGEEFDVGPGFIKRQTDEEERWHRRVQGWTTADSAGGLGREYLYEIRSLIMHGK